MIQPSIGGTADSAARRFERLVEEFGKAWEAGRPAGMAAVFTEDGSFVPSPFAAPVKGREAIRSYWADVPTDQAAITFRSGEVFVAGPWFSTEFTCTYRRSRTGEWMQISGALFCETSAERISEMRMYWERSAIEAP